MSQTSSPTLIYNLGGSVNEATSGGGRENFISKFPSSNKKFSAASTERFREWGFTQLLLYRMNLTSDQRILLEKLLASLNVVSTNYSNSILLKPSHLEFTRADEVPHARPGADVNFSLKRSGSKPLQLSPFEIIRWIRTKTGLSQDRIARLVGVSRQTLYNWEKGEPILDHNRQRLLQIKDVLERASSQHPTPYSLVTWLDTPRGAEGYTPAELLERNEIGKARLLAISSPSPRLKRPQSWIRRSVPEAFKSGEEHYDEALPPEYDKDFAILEEDEITEGLVDSQGDTDYNGGNSTIL